MSLSGLIFSSIPAPLDSRVWRDGPFFIHKPSELQELRSASGQLAHQSQYAVPVMTLDA
jgi:hypothetical protein